MKIAGLQKVSTIDYPGEIKLDTLRYRYASLQIRFATDTLRFRIPNKTIAFGHVFVWTLGGICYEDCGIAESFDY